MIPLQKCVKCSRETQDGDVMMLCQELHGDNFKDSEELLTAIHFVSRQENRLEPVSTMETPTTAHGVVRGRVVFVITK